MKNFDKLVNDINNIIFIGENNTYDETETWSYEFKFYYHRFSKQITLNISLEVDNEKENLELDHFLFIYFTKSEEPEGMNGIQFSEKLIYSSTEISSFEESLALLKKIAFVDGERKEVFKGTCITETENKFLPFEKRIMEGYINEKHDVELYLSRDSNILIIGELDNSIPSIFVSCDDYYNSNALDELKKLYKYLKNFEVK